MPTLNLKKYFLSQGQTSAEPVAHVKEMTETGQALLETTLALPIFLSITGFFLFFIYDQLWTQILEHILHEALVCEKTLSVQTFPEHCLQSANQRIQGIPILGKTQIYKLKNEYYAELKTLGEISWKKVHLKEIKY